MLIAAGCTGTPSAQNKVENMNVKPVIQPEEVIALISGSVQDLPLTHRTLGLASQEHFVIVDARSGQAGKEAYRTKRLQGAQHVDLDKDLAAVPGNAANGGRHPLPSVQRFGEVLGKLGITPDSYVFVYDDKNGANAAARLWWMLRSAGHEKVSVLDGGIQAAIAAGFPVEEGEALTHEADAPYPVVAWKLPMAGITDIDRMRQDSHALVIDVRDAVRFRGEKEPIDKIAGHIPGARNVPFSENLGPDGRFLPADSLRRKYETLLSGKETAVHCGSGVTACHTLLAIAHAGLPLPKLYVGSWSEWSNAGKPVATGE
jgi:thiosulfate/3-mercaptopyruvate sulfurtransferase